MTGIIDYLHKLFENHVRVILSMIGALLYNFFFPTTHYLYSTIAVLVMMSLDLLTKLYSLKRQAGGWKASIASKKINSFSLFRGTIDKLIVLGVMMIICGCAYQLTLIADVAIWFTQVVYILMFLRDALSIIENLRDAGVQNLGMFEKVIQKKLNEYVDNDDITKG